MWESVTVWWMWLPLCLRCVFNVVIVLHSSLPQWHRHLWSKPLLYNYYCVKVEDITLGVCVPVRARHRKCLSSQISCWCQLLFTLQSLRCALSLTHTNASHFHDNSCAKSGRNTCQVMLILLFGYVTVCLTHSTTCQIHTPHKLAVVWGKCRTSSSQRRFESIRTHYHVITLPKTLAWTGGTRVSTSAPDISR